MPNITVPWIPALLLSLGLQAPGAWAQTLSGSAEQLHAKAVAAFRQARFSEAYGQLISLADAGHAPSAELALFMYSKGPTLFDKDWDCSPEQLSAWARLARQPAPILVARSYAQPPVKVAMQTRRSPP